MEFARIPARRHLPPGGGGVDKQNGKTVCSYVYDDLG